MTGGRKLDAVDVNEPLVPGQTYKVPCMHYPYFGRTDWWPVLGPAHKDKAFLNFDHLHVHIDGRFLSARQRRFLAWKETRGGRNLEKLLGSAPLNHADFQLPEPQVRRRKCWIAEIGYPYHDKPQIKKIVEHFAGRQCAMSERGWVCPHQATPLGSIKPIDGVLTCPLHGLRIDAKSGFVLPPIEKAAR